MIPDELEALFQKRSQENEKQESARSITNELLLAQNNPGVLLMGATNF